MKDNNHITNIRELIPNEIYKLELGNNAKFE